VQEYNGRSFSMGTLLNQSEQQLIGSNDYGYTYRCLQILTRQCIKMSVNGMSTIFGFASLVIRVVSGCGLTYLAYWPPLSYKEVATCSLPHPENEHQQSVNDFWFCIIGNQSCEWLWAFINGVLAAFVGQRESDMLPAPS
jgi:hypothetical protein